MAKKKRSKIRYCFEDYCKTITPEEKAQYRKQNAPFIDIVLSSADDDEIMQRVRAYDAEHQTEFLDEAIRFKIYCIACRRVDCIC